MITAGTIYRVSVISELYEVRSFDFPENEVYQRFIVAFQTPKGRRFHHEVSFPEAFLAYDPEEGGFYRRAYDAPIKAAALADQINAHLQAGGNLNKCHWVEAAPVYGSEAYIEMGYEDVLITIEKEKV